MTTAPAALPPAHTPLPWATWNGSRTLILGGRDKHGDETMVAFAHGGDRRMPQDGAYVPKDAEARANAALIVRAVNNHEALVKALELVRHNWAGHAEQCAYVVSGYEPEERLSCDCDWPKIRTQIDETLARAKEPQA